MLSIPSRTLLRFRLSGTAALTGLMLVSCAPSPLYQGASVPTTPGNVPRDTNGNPVWNKLPPAPLAKPDVHASR